MLILSRLDPADPAGRAKVFVWRNVGSARRVTLSSLKGEPARWDIDHGRLYETEQQSAIFKAMFILYCIRLAMSVF